jgi:hypothetical protein
MADATYQDLLGDKILLHYDASDAGSMFTDTSASTPVTDGDPVRAWSQQATASLSGNLIEATNPPTYREDYSDTGYPGIEFDGVADILDKASDGNVSDGVFVLIAVDRPATAGTRRWFGVGESSADAFLGGSASAVGNSIQVRLSNSNVILVTYSKARGREVIAYSFLSGHLQATEIGAGSSGTAGVNTYSGTYTNRLHLGSQFGTTQFVDGAIHEILIASHLAEWGQVVRCAKIMREKWGIDDPSPMPQKIESGGGGGFYNPFATPHPFGVR